MDNQNIDEELKWRFDKVSRTLDVFSGSIIKDYYRPRPNTPWRKYSSIIRKVVFHQWMRIIGRQAFWGYSNIEEVVIPHSVTNIRAYAFGNCRNLHIVKMSREPYSISAFNEKNWAPCGSIILWPGAFENTPWKDDGRDG